MSDLFDEMWGSEANENWATSECDNFAIAYKEDNRKIVNDMKIIKTIWGSGQLQSTVGLILAENEFGKRNWYLGSAPAILSEREAQCYILRWGNKYSEEEFNQLIGE